ncbi:hypothetical protein A2U01_0001382 [Trifolium medium]|uniref:Uncharacterized protein n=1 Tax=Trifolium medium TaxID=97028 RepID=A0A392LZZ6_9FABA|nr:hypothetical protein [Trifolium medium]
MTLWRSVKITHEAFSPHLVVVVPPAFGHDPLFSEETEVVVSNAEKGILESLGHVAMRNVIKESSVAVFNLLEAVSFLNGRECKYLQERDDARQQLTLLEKKLSESEVSCEAYREQHKTLSSDLQKAEDKIKMLDEEWDAALQEVKE